MARIRSPNYPQISLPGAIERARSIYKAERQNRVDRDVALRLMGFGGYNGASAAILSAVQKYGLLERLGDGEVRVSDLAVRILVPHDDVEKLQAIHEAASNPPLFKELAERWPETHPSDHSLRTYLTRRGFADSALEGVMRAYAETLSLVNDHMPQYDPAPIEEQEMEEIEPNPAMAAKVPSANITPSEPAVFAAEAGPGMNLVRTKGGYVVYLSGAVLSKEHVDEVVTLLTALKASMPDKAPEGEAITEH